MFENCFKYCSEKGVIGEENVYWKTVNDETIPDFIQDHAIAIILHVAEKIARNEKIGFSESNFEVEIWTERIFIQIADFYVRLNRNY